MLMVAQISKYTKNHQIIYFKQVNFMACKLHVNKAVFKLCNEISLHSTRMTKIKNKHKIYDFFK